MLKSAESINYWLFFGNSFLIPEIKLGNMKKHLMLGTDERTAFSLFIWAFWHGIDTAVYSEIITSGFLMFIPAKIQELSVLHPRRRTVISSTQRLKCCLWCHPARTHELARLYSYYHHSLEILLFCKCLTFKMAEHRQSQIQSWNLLINVKLPLECCS